MRRTILGRFVLLLVATAVSTVATATATAPSALSYRCYIDVVDDYSDGNCTDVVGAVARGCNGAIAWEWGEQTGHWFQYIDGGYVYCPLSGCGEEFHDVMTCNCPPPTR